MSSQGDVRESMQVERSDSIDIDAWNNVCIVRRGRLSDVDLETIETSVGEQ